MPEAPTRTQQFEVVLNPVPKQGRETGAITRWLVVLLVAALVPWSSPLHAQERTGHIYGNVVDESGGVVIGATVKIVEMSTGYERVVTTNDDGNYSAPRLQTGTYSVEVGLEGFTSVQRTGIVLGPGTITEIDFKLAVGRVADTTVVSAAPPTVNSSSGAVRTSISPVFVDRIPLNGRNANDLIRIVPGITTGVDGKYAANGIRETSNNFTLDGTDNSDTWEGAASRHPPPDALDEFAVQSNYSAEFGFGGGVAVIAITKSGTNQLRGSVYDYFRSENLNANTFERNAEGLPKPDFKQHQWGFTVGGPVHLPRLYDGRNKTFFFLNHQRLGTPAAPYLWRRGGLTAAELSGDFSKSPNIPTVSRSAANAPNSPFAGMEGQQITDLSPYLSQTAVRWYQLLGFPTVENSGDFFSVEKAASQNQPEYAARVDHNLTASNRLSFSMFYRKNEPEPRLRNYNPEGFLQGRRTTHQHYSLSDVWTLGSSLVNEVSLGYNRIYDAETAEFGPVGFEAFGFPFPAPSSRQFLSLKPELSPNRIEANAPTYKLEAREVYDFRNTLSFFKGAHFMKAGVNFQLNDLYQEVNANMEFQYEGGWLGNRAAEFLIGWPTSFGSIEASSTRPIRRERLSAFVQDDWKISPRLTLNLGLRWEPQQWGYHKENSVLIFMPGAQSRYSNFPPGVILVDDAASPGRSGRNDDWDNFAPRLGAAYRLDESGRRVLRGGWGIFYDVVTGVKDGIDLHSDAFIQSYGTAFDIGYPGREEWTNIFAYNGLPVPEFTGGRIDPADRVFNPRGAPGLYQPPIENGYVHQFNITYEQEFRPGWSYSAAYIGSRGVRLWGLDWWNLPVRRDANDSWDADNMASRRPDQRYPFDDKMFVADNGKSTYNAAQVTLKANTRTVHLLSHYTFSRAYANIDGLHSAGDAAGYGRSNPTDLEADWARSVMDVPHRLLVAFSWDLPFLRDRGGPIGAVLGGWAATSVFNIQSGRLVNVLASQNNTYTCEQCWVRPNATGEPLINDGWRDDPDLVYVNAGAFSEPPDGTFGNLPRNAVRWPHTKNVDLSLSKRFSLVGDSKFELRLDVFNLFNWVNFRAPDRIRLSDPGTLTMWDEGMLAPRTMQVGGRILF